MEEDKKTVLTYERFVVYFHNSDDYYLSAWKANVNDILQAKHFRTEKTATNAVKRLNKVVGNNCYCFPIRITVEPI